MAAAMQAETQYLGPNTLLPNERMDLQWFFDEAEGHFGVRSNFGAAQDELQRRSLSDEARGMLKAARRKSSIAWRNANKEPKIDYAFRTLYRSLGIKLPKSGKLVTHELPEWARQYIRSKGMGGGGMQSYEQSIDLDAVDRACHVRTRLQGVGSNYVGVLYGAFGPKSKQWAREAHGNPDHPVTKLRDPALGEIAAAILASTRDEGDPQPQALMWTATSSPAAVSRLKEECLVIFDQAQAAYASTRCTHPCNGCWPG